MDSATRPQLEVRRAALEMGPEEFRAAGHKLVDEIAAFLESIPRRPVVPPVTPRGLRQVMGTDSLPERGTPAGALLDDAARLLFDNSLLSSHPRFWGYIMAGPAPIGILADLLASAVDPNTGGWILAPIASEIERQTGVSASTARRRMAELG